MGENRNSGISFHYPTTDPGSRCFDNGELGIGLVKGQSSEKLHSLCHSYCLSGFLSGISTSWFSKVLPICTRDNGELT